MKQCPRCHQTFSDETQFCLSDGAQLLFDAPEEMTVIKPFAVAQSTPQITVRQGVSPIFAYLAAGLLLLVIGGVFASFLILWSSKNETPKTISNANDLPTNANQPTNSPKLTLQEEQALLEKEKQRLAEERKKLEAQKNKVVETSSTSVSQPTARINFRKGNAQETITGSISTKRSFVLRANAGQYMWASLNSGNGCVSFSNGANDIGFTTIKGDNRLTVINNCDWQTTFNFTVSIR